MFSGWRSFGEKKILFVKFPLAAKGGMDISTGSSELWKSAKE